MIEGVITVWEAVSTRELQEMMADWGVKFKNIKTTYAWTQSLVADQDYFPLLGLFLLFSSSMKNRHGFMEIDYYVRRWMDREQEKLEAEKTRQIYSQVETALDLLRRRYEDKDPFADFGPAQRPASQYSSEIWCESTSYLMGSLHHGSNFGSSSWTNFRRTLHLFLSWPFPMSIVVHGTAGSPTQRLSEPSMRIYQRATGMITFRLSLRNTG